LSLGEEIRILHRGVEGVAQHFQRLWREIGRRDERPLLTRLLKCERYGSWSNATLLVTAMTLRIAFVGSFRLTRLNDRSIDTLV